MRWRISRRWTTARNSGNCASSFAPIPSVAKPGWSAMAAHCRRSCSS